MKIAFDAKSKKKIKLSLLFGFAGLLIVGLAFSPILNHPQCPNNSLQSINGSSCIVGADIGAGMVFLLGVTVALVGFLTTGILFLWGLAKNSKHPKRGMYLIIAACLVALLAVGYLFKVQQDDAYRSLKEIRNQSEKFVSYEGIPKAGAVTGATTAISMQPDTANPRTIIIDLQDCSPGANEVSFGLGSTHFAFSGIKDRQCVFYFGTEIENPNWDGSLNILCKAPILDTLPANQKEFPVTNDGINFGTFKDNYCINLETGRGFGI